ncbi:MAG: DUF5063 domain-containing protein [Bacteroidales bacterium]|nr:DUF5063 domain-containing protein [Bacteroidales bacterium]
MSGSDSPVYKTDVINFVKIANEFTKFIEESDKTDLSDFIDKAHKLLPELYLMATLLPVLDAKFEDFNQRFVNEQDYEYVRGKMLSKLGQYDSYEEVFNKLGTETEDNFGASISENLADIYQDIKDFVLLYEIGSNEVMYEAIWECRQAFETYWGQRLTNALRALHFLRYTDEEIIEDENFIQNSDELPDDLDTSDWIISKRQEDYSDDEK